MDYNIYEDKRSNGFTMASIILGIIGIATGCCVYTSIICGALAIIFALLSRGGEMTMSDRARTGLILGIIGIVIGILILVWAFVTLIAEFGSLAGYMEYYYKLMEPFMSSYPETL